MTLQQLEELFARKAGELLAPFAETQRAHTDIFAKLASGRMDRVLEEFGEKGADEPGIGFARSVKVAIIARQAGQTARVVAESMYPKDKRLTKALSEGTQSAGGYLVFPEFSRELIPLLRDQSVVRRAGATVLPMNSNVLNIQSQSGGGSAEYVAENANIAYSTEEAFGQIALSAKKLAAMVAISNDLLRDASIDADRVVRDDLIAVIALREDKAFLRDDGTSNKPKGILNTVAAAQKFNANATINAANVIADLKKAVEKVYVGKKGNVRRLAWFMSPRSFFYLKTVRDSGFFVFPEMWGSPQPIAGTQGGQFAADGTLFGYPVFISGQIPENLGGGTDESEVYLTDMSDAIIGQNMDLEVSASAEAAYHNGSSVVAAFSLDQTVLRAISRHDFTLRYDKAASIIQQVKWGV